MATISQKKEVKQKKLARPGMTVELVKGNEWRDEEGSGITLYRGFYEMASEKQMANDKELKRTGYVKLDDEKKPYAKLDNDLTDEQLIKVEKALRLGILKEFDPKNPTVYVDFRGRYQEKTIPDDNSTLGYRFTDQDENLITKILKLPLDSFKREIQNLRSNKFVEKVYEAEYGGRNVEARPRKPYIDIIKEHMEKRAAGVGNIKTKNEGSVNINIPNSEAEEIS